MPPQPPQNEWLVSNRYDLTIQNMNLEITKPSIPSHVPTRTPAPVRSWNYSAKLDILRWPAPRFHVTAEVPIQFPRVLFPSKSSSVLSGVSIFLQPFTGVTAPSLFR